jgi:RHS repeat-associated protein
MVSKIQQPQSVNSAKPGSESLSAVLPSVSLPRGGGAIRGLGEKFGANPTNGTGSLTIPIAISPGRTGVQPDLTLSYDSGNGNGPFGFGWRLALPAITRKTDKGIPQYHDVTESDVFTLTSAEDLVPVLVKDGQGHWERESRPTRTVNGVEYQVRRYRPRIEGLFARIERWTNTSDASDVFWRSISKDNITTWYGKSSESRIADPADPTRIFSWLICQTHDDKGNVIVYGYKGEDSAHILLDASGNVLSKSHERNRTERTRTAQRYLKRVRYGNRTPYFPALRSNAPWPEPLNAADGSTEWMFEAVFDYGEHTAPAPLPLETGIWPVRQDPFSSYRAAFEIRTYRLCRRILMFHHFPKEAGVGRNCLVRSTDLTYSDMHQPVTATNSVYVFLKAYTQTGFRRRGSTYTARSWPPVEFEYSAPRVNDTVEIVEGNLLENLPIGIDGTLYRWVDLHGEGVPGILTEQANAWFYTRNRSPMTGMADFAPLENVRRKPVAALNAGAELIDLSGDGQPDIVTQHPSPGLYRHDEDEGWEAFRPFRARLTRDLRDLNARFIDLDGDGNLDVLITEEDVLVWHASLAEDGFGPAQRIANALDEDHGPRVVFRDSTQSISLADLSGDGLTDIVRVRNGEVVYWPNLGYGRFGAKVTMDNAPWFDNPDQFDQARVRLADIDGSGTTDLIYLHRDGVRLYFNQAGNSWSTPTQLAAFPRIDDAASILPIDLLGTGTVCLVWSSPLAGDAAQPLRYVNLMGGQKPHLLVRIANNLGAETRITYAPSTKFYLLDQRSGTPWITRLPFPVHVVEKITTLDHISRTRFVAEYAYHHGYFDGEEREFRGFGMVEQWDTEAFATHGDGSIPADNLAPESHVPPIHTKTWFHTGVYLGRDRVANYFAGLSNAADSGEYFREPGLTNVEAQSLLLPDTIVPADLTPEEEREACRALKGSMLRREVYADDAGENATIEHVRRARTPYTVTEQNFTIRTLQPRGPNRHAIFYVSGQEALNFHYERNPSDPRIQHTLTLEVDAYGNVLKQASIGYGRRATLHVMEPNGVVRTVPNSGLTSLDQTDQAKQITPLLTYTENRFSIPKDHPNPNDVSVAIDEGDVYRIPLLSETVTFELTGYTPTGTADRFQASDFVERDPASRGLRHRFTDQVPYEGEITDKPCRRPIEWVRTLYRRDDLSSLLPLGRLDAQALHGEQYMLAITPGLVNQVLRRPRLGQAAELLLPDPASVLGGTAGDEGGYVRSQTLKADGRFPTADGDDFWWIPSGTVHYTVNPLDTAATELQQARRHFYLPRRSRDPFAHDAFVDFDSNDLLTTETRDNLGNRVTVDVNDYRVLQPRLVSDPNGNRTEIAFDTIGMVVGTAVMGKPAPAPAEGDTLSGFTEELSHAERDAFFDSDDPHATAPDLLKGASTRVVYDLDRFFRTQQAHPNDPGRWQPTYAATLTRETHQNAPLPPHGLKIQLSFSYSDGFGREIQKKIQAEPESGHGRVGSIRWVGSGWTIFNNKGKPVRQYEPFFSTRQRPDGTLFSDHRFEFGVILGVSPVLFYDPADRVIATLHPNHTYEKVVFDPWQQTTYDVNDTCAPLHATDGDRRSPQTGDPRTDPDVQGYVKGYFKAQPENWQTWHTQRIGGAMGQHEQDAARRAATHAGTPTAVHFDVLGRPFLTLAHNRVECIGHDLDGADDSFATRIDLDIEGNQRAVIDERKLPIDHLPKGAVERRAVMSYAYDMLGNRIHQHSMEAGARWILNDVTGKPIRAWDSRGHTFTTTYDELRRPIAQSVRGTTAASDPQTLNRDVLIDKIEYGEPPRGATSADEAEAQRLNLRTRIYRHFDTAGVVTNAAQNPVTAHTEGYDFKGNVLRSVRRLVSDYASLPDWQQSPQLDDERFESSTRYDALNRPIQLIAPHSSLARSKRNVIQPVFNEAGLLERVNVWLERTDEPNGLLDPLAEAPSDVGIANIDYDAKGQRVRVDYRNAATTQYHYDPRTFRLTHLYTRRGPTFTADCDNPSPPPPTMAAPDIPPEGQSCGLQNLHYTYDPAGNITHIHDTAQQPIYFRNKRVEPSSDFTYDALYRLIEARGREHLGQSGSAVPTPAAHSHSDVPRTTLPHPGDGNAVGTYVERYVYDAVGNVLQMQHKGTDPVQPGWTRRYAYEEASLIESGKRSNRLSSTQVGNGVASAPEPYQYDTHGNMTGMPHLTSIRWDFKDQLYATSRQAVNETPPPDRVPETTFYTYDATGQRVRKVTVRQNGTRKEERVYIAGYEVHRTYDGTGNAILRERETLHITDDKQRIAIAETRTLDTAGDDPAPRQLIRYQFGNHLGSACLELDNEAQIISYEEYSPYGSTTYQAVRSQTETPKRYRYTGKERDEESGLYYHGARYYAPWLGRWTKPDPLYLKDATNVYIYALNNPVIAKDPTGGPIWVVPFVAYLGYKALTSAAETAVETGIAHATDDQDFSIAGTFFKNMVVNSTIGAIPGTSEAKIGVKTAAYVAKLTLSTTADATLDTVQGKGDFSENFVKSGIGNVGGDLLGVGARKVVEKTGLGERVSSVVNARQRKEASALTSETSNIQGIEAIPNLPVRATARAAGRESSNASNRVFIDTSVLIEIAKGTDKGVILERQLQASRAAGVDFAIPRPVLSEIRDQAQRATIERLGLPIDEGLGLANRAPFYDQAVERGILFEGLLGKPRPTGDLVIGAHTKAAGASLWSIDSALRPPGGPQYQLGVPQWVPK